MNEKQIKCKDVCPIALVGGRDRVTLGYVHPKIVTPDGLEVILVEKKRCLGEQGGIVVPDSAVACDCLLQRLADFKGVTDGGSDSRILSCRWGEGKHRVIISAVANK